MRMCVNEGGEGSTSEAILPRQPENSIETTQTIRMPLVHSAFLRRLELLQETHTHNDTPLQHTFSPHWQQPQSYEIRNSLRAVKRKYSPAPHPAKWHASSRRSLKSHDQRSVLTVLNFQRRSVHARTIPADAGGKGFEVEERIETTPKSPPDLITQNVVNYRPGDLWASFTQKFILCGRVKISLMEILGDYERSARVRGDDHADEFHCVEPNGAQLATCLDLGFSISVPVLCIPPENVFHITDEVPSPGTWASRSTRPRCKDTSGARRASRCSARTTSRPLPSQVKIKLDFNNLHPAHSIFDLLVPPRVTLPIRLSRLTILSLMHNGMPKETFVELMRETIEEEVVKKALDLVSRSFQDYVESDEPNKALEELAQEIVKLEGDGNGEKTAMQTRMHCEKQFEGCGEHDEAGRRAVVEQILTRLPDVFGVIADLERRVEELAAIKQIQLVEIESLRQALQESLDRIFQAARDNSGKRKMYGPNTDNVLTSRQLPRRIHALLRKAGGEFSEGQGWTQALTATIPNCSQDLAHELVDAMKAGRALSVNGTAMYLRPELYIIINQLAVVLCPRRFPMLSLIRILPAAIYSKRTTQAFECFKHHCGADDSEPFGS
ncbi:hypothetical protein LXA43DRAFT_1065048 [Ganoderma leucocontextum]|nr:hypothetical protein LXA43DRAFT_1065048 [Ganoderma leucocontextum]